MVIAKNNRPLRVAYIEDNHEDAEALLKSWTEFRPQIVNKLDLFRSAREYVEQLRSDNAVFHDLILLDLSLPDMHGIDLGKKLKTDPDLSGQSLIVVTASDAETAKSAQELIGAEGWAEKPIRAAGILSEIGKIGLLRPWYGIEIVRQAGDYGFTV